MLVDDIRARVAQAVKQKDDVGRDVLRLALGEIQSAEARASRALRDEEAAAILRKLLKSNEETLAASEGERAAALRHENELLSALLPKGMSVEQIVEALAPVKDAIRAAKNDGQATGVAMKHLKSSGGTFEGTDVAAAVKQLRA